MNADDYVDPDQAANAFAELSELAKHRTAKVDLEAFGEAYALDARLKSARQRWEQACPPDLKESDWTHPAMRPCADQIKQVLAHKAGGPKGVCAAGPTGYGKSRAMWALLGRFACEEARDVRCYVAIDWFNTLQSHLTFGRDEARGWVETVARRPIVFIDDFGQEALQTSRQDWAMSWFFRFLDIRVGERLPLYMTTNLSAEDMANARGAATRGNPLVRRLLDLCEFVRFPGV